MARRKSKARTVKVLPQHGKSVTTKDKKRTAKLPGVRISASGNKYTETRKNRSDRRGSRV